MSTTPEEIDSIYESVRDKLDDKRDAFRAGFLVGLRWLAHGATGVSEEVEQAFDLELDLSAWNIERD